MKKEFINKIKGAALEGYEKYGILASLTMSQAILESGWGRKHIGNNIFGIKKGSSWKGPTRKVVTHEHIGGRKVKVYDEFRVYPSIEDSIRDYHLLLISLKRYRKVVQAKDYKEACREIQKSGYATDPNYGKKLKNIIESNRLYIYDRKRTSEPSPWAEEAWNWARKNKLTDGSRPRSYATRQEVILILYRFTRQIKTNML